MASSDHADNFWHGRRCLITGADGFLATHLAGRLLEEGALVHGTLRMRVRGVSRLDLFNLRPKLTLFSCDLRDYRSLLDIIAGEGIDTIFHVAASALVNTATRTPLATIESNVLGTANVLEACRQVGVKRIVVASSDKAYGDHRSRLPYKETHTLQGLHIYDCSKSCTDLIAQTYYFQYHLPVRVTRCCNIYGPGDLNFSRLIPGTIMRILGEIPPVIREGQAQVKREYLAEGTARWRPHLPSFGSARRAADRTHRDDAGHRDHDACCCVHATHLAWFSRRVAAA